MARIYIASKYEEKEEVEKAYKLLESKGHTITYKWTNGEYPNKIDIHTKNSEICVDAYNGIVSCTSFIFLATKKLNYRASYVEFGIAIQSLAMGLIDEIVVIGHGIDECVFVDDCHVARFDTLIEYLDWI